MARSDVTGIWVPHFRVYCLQHSGFDDAGKDHKIICYATMQQIIKSRNK